MKELEDDKIEAVRDKIMNDAHDFFKDMVQIPYKGRYTENGEPFGADYIEYLQERLIVAEGVYADFRKYMDTKWRER